MANDIKGITVKIGADTTDLSKTMSSANRSISTTQKQLNEVQKALKLDPSNTGSFWHKNTDCLLKRQTKQGKNSRH